MKLGFIGLGAMGFGMAKNLALKSGKQVLVADLNPKNMAAFDHGDYVRSSTAEIAEQAEIVFLSLPSIINVEEVCLGHDGLLANKKNLKVIVDMSTSDVTRTQSLAEQLAADEVLFLDAPVARSREAANNGTLLITVGGEKTIFEQLMPYLSCMGTDVVHCGDIGSGQITKILNNMVLLSTVNALAEACYIAKNKNMDLGILVDTLSLGSANSYALSLVGKHYLAKDTFPEKLFSAAYALKDISLADGLAQSISLQAKGIKATKDNLENACNKGWGDAYYPVIYKTMMT